jgi:effector-binding domain-containing protein
MDYEIERVDAESGPIAKLTRRGTLQQIGELTMPALDELWGALRPAGVQTGHNLIIYRDAGGGQFDMDIGVQVAPGTALDHATIQLSSTPSGRTAHTLHRGPYDGLPAAYDAIRAWAQTQGLTLSGTAWEIYGDWTDDQSKLETDVYYLLA